MKVMKSLLLGSAAGLVTVAGAQAADLPVKAKPVEYVKICPAYGAGFYYIPGTDICLRVGGFLRADYYINSATDAGHPPITDTQGSDLIYNRDDTKFGYRARGALILDARTATAYGTLRSYAVFHNTLTKPATVGTQGAAAGVDAAFIQFAGFTFGWARSFYDFHTGYSYTGVPGLSNRLGTLMAAYTAQFGGGVTGTLAIESNYQRMTKIVRGTLKKTFKKECFTEHIGETGIIDPNDPCLGFGSTTVDTTLALSGGYSGTSQVGGVGANYGGQVWPDIVANIRVDQAWGSAQVMGALHNVHTSQRLKDASVKSKWGYAIGAGIEWKLDTIAPGDRLALQGTWSKGAFAYNDQYVFNSKSAFGHRSASGKGPLGDIFDAGVLGDGSLKLSTTWSVAGGIRHFWTPTLRSNLGAGYLLFKPDSAVQKSLGFPDIRVWQAVAATIWSPVPNLDLGVEIMYAHVKTKKGRSFTFVDVTPDSDFDVVVSKNKHGNDSKGVWSGMLRAQRNF